MVDKTLQELLDEAGIKQVDMTKVLKLSESHVSLLVAGKRRMSIDYAAQFAQSLNTSIDAVFEAINFAKCKYNNQKKEISA